MAATKRTKKPRRVNLFVRIDPEVRACLGELAEEYATSVNRMTERALRLYLVNMGNFDLDLGPPGLP